MTMVRSLRTRMMLGAALWTGGLFLAAAVVLTVAMVQFPRAHFVLYGWFAHALAFAAILAVVSLIAGLWQVKHGLSGLDDLRSRLVDVREGRAVQIEGEHPPEVEPLVADLNALLDHRERAVNRAVAKAGDLAHGLKTPLAVLFHEGERVKAAGHPDLAATIFEQAERMQRQVDYHLAHTRAAASGAALGARCRVLASAEGLARALLRLNEGRGLAIDVNVAAGHTVRVQREDLDEMLGNLLDNACTWAKSRVSVESSEHNATIVLTIDDDGPGLEASKRDVVLQRGVRADEAAPGSGLGLAIVRDLADVYGGSIALSDSPKGGLRATLELPSC